MSKRFFSEVEVGDTFENGGYTISHDEMIEFAEKYDPQDFHLTDEGAEETIFDEVSASGLLTLSACNRLVVEGVFDQLAVMGGPGIDEVRFPEPVYAGDSLTVVTEAVDKRPSENRADRGYIDFQHTGYAQDDNEKIRYRTMTIVRRASTD